MLARIARTVIAAPKRVLLGAFALLLLCGVFGAQVSSHLAAGGFADPGSQSSRAVDLLDKTFGRGGLPVVIELSEPDSAASPIVADEQARAKAQQIAAGLRGYSFVQQPILSLWDTPGAAAALQSRDGHSGLIVANVSGGDKDAAKNAQRLHDRFTSSAGDLTVKVGGQAMVYSQVNEQTSKDLQISEMIAIPISFLLLIWVFGGVVAALLPLITGAFAIVGTAAILRGFTAFTDVSVFALNLTTVMGLALAIDYSLLIINRYREEVADGLDRNAALVKSISTAGRTVLFSSVTVGLSMAAMAVFPMYFLRSFAYAGLGVVALAAVAAIVITPAVLALLGDRVDSLDLRRPIRRLLGRPEPKIKRPEESMWYRTTSFVLRHAIPVGVAVIALLLVLGAPFIGIKFGYPDDRVLPASATAHQVGDDLRNDYGQNASASVTIVLPASGGRANDVHAYQQRLSQIAGVTSVTGPDVTVAAGRDVAPGDPTSRSGQSEFLTVATTLDPFSTGGKDQLNALHDVPAPAGVAPMFNGLAQQNVDNVNSIIDRLPLVLGIIAVTTFILLFLLTGSVVLPLKALVLNVFSLTATFGALVWIFQDGHLGGFGVDTTGYLIANMPALMFCVAFGLSMDYEVFLMSRIREEWLAGPKTREGNDHAVAYGLARTGRVVTAAALLMAIVFAGLIASQVSFMRMFGVGLTIAVLMDATLVRMLLVPAFMRVAGRANWWAPKPLRRLHDRIGLSEEPTESDPASAAAASDKKLTTTGP
ncbi:MMPL family transporter [Jongsikchunia kroppenstedtii]|uniref:MMPL family transporter n=1 Tax=Jongsikchunia kroppenstedtii TaxID=1121721 RepID=UPI00036E49BA|nr:MMPL family transporter [Jongsikchunia kroppenstedtii]